jgi:hypothetical protein
LGIDYLSVPLTTTGSVFVLAQSFQESELLQYNTPGPDSGPAWFAPEPGVDLSSYGGLSLDSSGVLHWVLEDLTANPHTLTSYSSPLAAPNPVAGGTLPNACGGFVPDPSAPGWLAMCGTSAPFDLVHVLPDGTTQTLIPQAFGPNVALELGMINGVFAFFEYYPSALMATGYTLKGCDPVTMACKQQSLPLTTTVRNGGYLGYDNSYIYYQDADATSSPQVGAIRRVAIALQ